MILVNTVPNPKSVAPKLQKLYNRKVSINVAHRHQQRRLRHQPGKTYSLVEMKFRRDKNVCWFSLVKIIMPPRLSALTSE